jgi:hypothetical protein
LQTPKGITTGWNHSTFFFGQALRMRTLLSDPRGEERAFARLEP